MLMRILKYGWEFLLHISGGLGGACFRMTNALSELGRQGKEILWKAIGGAYPCVGIRPLWGKH